MEFREPVAPFNDVPKVTQPPITEPQIEGVVPEVATSAAALEGLFESPYLPRPLAKLMSLRLLRFPYWKCLHVTCLL